MFSHHSWFMPYFQLNLELHLSILSPHICYICFYFPPFLSFFDNFSHCIRSHGEINASHTKPLTLQLCIWEGLWNPKPASVFFFFFAFRSEVTNPPILPTGLHWLSGLLWPFRRKTNKLQIWIVLFLYAGQCRNVDRNYWYYRWFDEGLYAWLFCHLSL